MPYNAVGVGSIRIIVAIHVLGSRSGLNPGARPITTFHRLTIITARAVIIIATNANIILSHPKAALTNFIVDHSVIPGQNHCERRQSRRDIRGSGSLHQKRNIISGEGRMVYLFYILLFLGGGAGMQRGGLKLTEVPVV